MGTRKMIDPEIKKLAREHDVDDKLLWNRLHCRWIPEIAATTPKGELPPGRFLPKPQRPTTTVTVTKWTEEQLQAHLQSIGPDKNWKDFHNPVKSSEIAITAPRQRICGSYFKPGEAW